MRASFKVIRHVRPKRSCQACDRIVQAPAPSRPIDRGLAGPGLLAHVLTSKYADHQPLYRQSEIYAREGVDLDRSTLAGWVGAASDLLAPLIDAVRKHVLSASKLHADDTPVPVLAPGLGKTKTGRLWTYVRDDRPSADTVAPAVWFAYSPDRKGSTRSGTWNSSPAPCRPMRMPAFITSTIPAGSVKRRVGRMHAVSSTRSTLRILHLSPRKRSTGSLHSTLSKRRSGAKCRSCAGMIARLAPRRCSRACTLGSKPRLRSFLSMCRAKSSTGCSGSWTRSCLRLRPVRVTYPRHEAIIAGEVQHFRLEARLPINPVHHNRSWCRSIPSWRTAEVG